MPVSRVARVHRSLARRTPALVLTAYLAAVAAPGLGCRANRTALIHSPHLSMPLPAALLGLTLLTSGLSVDPNQLRAVIRRPRMFLVGVTANVVVPLVLLVGLSPLIMILLDGTEAQSVLAGLTLVAAMPVGGTAAAWTASQRGNTALGVGLVLGSVAVSPLTIPLGLSVGSLLALGDYADDLSRLTTASGGATAVLSALVPCLLGIAVRMLLRERIDPALPAVRLITLLDIVLLAYVNASGTLGRLLAAGDADFLLAVTGSAAVMCLGSFALGWLLSRGVRSSRADAIALTYATGLNNASMGAVLGSAGLRDHPLVLAPVLTVSVLQMLTAGLFARLLDRPAKPARSECRLPPDHR